MHGHVILVCIEPKMRRFENAHVSSSMRHLFIHGLFFRAPGVFFWTGYLMDGHWARKMTTIDDTPRAPFAHQVSTCNDHVNAIDRHDD
jgi:hypothetical protein